MSTHRLRLPVPQVLEEEDVTELGLSHLDLAKGVDEIELPLPQMLYSVVKAGGN